MSTHLRNRKQRWRCINRNTGCRAFVIENNDTYTLSGLLKSEADQVVITVMEVFREEQSVRRVRARSRSNTDRLQMLWHEYTAGQRNAISLVQAASNILP